MTATTKPARPRLPILEGILPFDPSRLPNELIAGATLAALAIPETMGYATMAGMPVVTGLYTLLIPIVLFALLGSSRHLVVGADSATAVVLASGLASLGLTTGSAEYVAMAGLAALMVAGGPARRAAAPARIHRQLPVAQRADRLPDRRRASRWRWASSTACSGSTTAPEAPSRSSGRP